MSEQLSAAAAAMGIPETLVERSAEARAAEAGTSTEEILQAWAGGEAPPAPSEPEAAEEPETEEAAEEPVQEEEAPEPAAPEVVVETPTEEPEAPAAAAATGPYKPPVLVGARDNPMLVLAGIFGLFAIVILVGLIGPALQGDAPGARTSEIAYSEEALEGQEVYQTLNCAACHSQMVRPVIADVGLGAVTVHDSNQVLGTRRFGPDLSNVGSRITGDQLGAIVGGLGDHPPYDLSPEDMSALVSYLDESRTMESPASESEEES